MNAELCLWLARRSRLSLVCLRLLRVTSGPVERKVCVTPFLLLLHPYEKTRHSGAGSPDTSRRTSDDTRPLLDSSITRHYALAHTTLCIDHLHAARIWRKGSARKQLLTCPPTIRASNGVELLPAYSPSVLPTPQLAPPTGRPAPTPTSPSCRTGRSRPDEAPCYRLLDSLAY